MRHHIMSRYWWILAARGWAGILLGVAAFWSIARMDSGATDLFGMSLFVKPASVLATLILLLGAYALLDGVFSILLGLQDYGGGKRWPGLVLEGAASLGLGLFTWLVPGTTVLWALYGIAAWAFLTGALEIGQGLDLNEYRDRRPFLITAGAFSILFGLMVLVFQVGGMGLVWTLGAYALLFGAILLAAAHRLRRFARTGSER
jgi:uncharacterized membrane protein HdeD (DUF308 family)